MGQSGNRVYGQIYADASHVLSLLRPGHIGADLATAGRLSRPRDGQADCPMGAVVGDPGFGLSAGMAAYPNV